MIPCCFCDAVVGERFIKRFLLQFSAYSCYCLEGQRGRLEGDLNAVWRVREAVWRAILSAVWRVSEAVWRAKYDTCKVYLKCR